MPGLACGEFGDLIGITQGGESNDGGCSAPMAIAWGWSPSRLKGGDERNKAGVGN